MPVLLHCKYLSFGLLEILILLSLLLLQTKSSRDLLSAKSITVKRFFSQLSVLTEEDKIRASLGDTFFDWGIPAPVSLVQCRDCGLPLIASGGILDGIHVAASISMGATAAGVANAILKEATESAEAVKEKLTIIREELRAAMLLTGSKDLKQLSKAQHVVLGETKQWMDQL